MKIERYVMGMFNTNTYVLCEGDKCIVIDPASKEEKLIEIIGERKLLAILLTHGHFDHIKACDGLSDFYKCPIYIAKEDEQLARNKNQGAAFRLQFTSSITKPLEYLKEGNMQIGPFEFEVIKTPGHTKGSVCYKFKNDMFTGDTLFRLSVGRTDLEGGSDKDLKQSLKLIKEIKENLNIYPGHEDISNLDYERINNPYLN